MRDWDVFQLHVRSQGCTVPFGCDELHSSGDLTLLLWSLRLFRRCQSDHVVVGHFLAFNVGRVEVSEGAVRICDSFPKISKSLHALFHALCDLDLEL